MSCAQDNSLYLIQPVPGLSAEPIAEQVEEARTEGLFMRGYLVGMVLCALPFAAITALILRLI